jgi:hypothetical protein
VPALAGARSAQHGGEARQRRVNVRLFAPQERARRPGTATAASARRDPWLRAVAWWLCCGDRDHHRTQIGEVVVGNLDTVGSSTSSKDQTSGCHFSAE